MPRSKKDSTAADTRNGKDRGRAPSATTAKGRGRNGAATAARDRPAARAAHSEPLLEVTVQPEGLSQFREAKEHLTEIVRQAKEARSQLQGLRHEREQIGRELGDAVRQTQRELAEMAREASEARRELEEIRELARDTHPRPDDTPKRSGRKGRQRAEETARARPESSNRLGVTVGSGVVIAEVLPDTPAVAAGLTRGDVIEVVNGTPIVSATELRDVVHNTRADSDVSLRIVRAGKAKDIRARLGAAKTDDDGTPTPNRFGVTVGPGVVVAEVLPDTPAAKAGLEHGDVIDEVNGSAVQSGEQLRDVVQQLPPGAEVVLHVTRAGKANEMRARLNGGAGKSGVGTRRGS